MREKLIIFALGAAWTAGLGVFGFVMAINNNIITLNSRVEYLEKQQDSFVQKDVFELEKMLLRSERVKTKP